MQKSKIEWTDCTWNPIRARDKATAKDGWFCVRVSEGCRNCYAARWNMRLGNQVDYAAQNRERVQIVFDQVSLFNVIKARTPRAIFVCSMSDLFGDFVHDRYIDAVFAAMALAPQHVFFVLTKRPDRMLSWFNRKQFDRHIENAQAIFIKTPPLLNVAPEFPLPNVWIGVSIEDKDALKSRLPVLIATPAARRFISFEPLLEDVAPHIDGVWRPTDPPLIDWIICGGESGDGARPMHPQWARGLRDWAQASGVHFQFKQWGAWRPIKPDRFIDPGRDFHVWPDGSIMQRGTKKQAGRLLDGVLHDYFPRPVVERLRHDAPT